MRGVSNRSRPSSACCRRRSRTTSGGCSSSTTISRSARRSSNMRNIRAQSGPSGVRARFRDLGSGVVIRREISSILRGSNLARPNWSRRGSRAPVFSSRRSFSAEIPSLICTRFRVGQPVISALAIRPRPSDRKLSLVKHPPCFWGGTCAGCRRMVHLVPAAPARLRRRSSVWRRLPMPIGVPPHPRGSPV